MRKKRKNIKWGGRIREKVKRTTVDEYRKGKNIGGRNEKAER